MSFFSVTWKVLIAFTFLFGIIVLTNEKQTLSLFRTIIFGILPILVSLVFFILRKNINFVIISVNILFLSLIMLSVYEIYLLYPKNINYSENERINFKNKKFCGNSFKNTNELSIYPLGGISKKDIKFKNEENFSESFRKSDRYGFNNEDKYWDTKKLNSVFIGDSFTYGADVNYYESFVDIYRKKVGPTINLACGGNGPLIEYATFIEYVKNLNLNPDYVFWVYYSGNDLQKDIVSEKVSFYGNYLNEDYNQNLIHKQDEIDELYSKFINLKKNNANKTTKKKKRKTDFLSFYKFKEIRGLIGLSSGYEYESLEILKKILKSVDDEIKKFDGKFIFIFIPSEKRYANFISYYDEYFYDLPIKEFLETNNIDFIYLDDQFSNYGNPKNFYSGHFNIKGNLLTFETIFNNL